MASYLITFLSILIGYIVTQFFMGWQVMLTESSVDNIYWLHLGWTILVFLYIIYIWWVFGFFQKEISRNFAFFFTTLIPCFLLYLIATFIFPDSSETVSTIDFQQFYYNQSPAFFSCCAALMFFSTLAAPIIFREPFFRNEQTYYRALLFLMFFIAKSYKNHIYHSVIFGICCVFLSLFIYNYFNKQQLSVLRNRMTSRGNSNTSQQP